VVCLKKYAAVIFILVTLAVSVATAAVMADTRQAWPIVTSPELNVTGADITNHTIPSRYGISPNLVDVKVELSDTSLPGPKGEMAAGPRTIGFSADPLLLAILVVVVVAIAAVTWCIVRRKPEEPDEKNG
jgi:hypothetical protein